MLASSLIGLAVSGRNAIGPRMPGRPGGRAMCGMTVAASVADVAAGEVLALLAVRLRRHLGDAGGGDPAIVEVEERADGDGPVDRLVVPAERLQRRDVVAPDTGQV